MTSGQREWTIFITQSLALPEAHQTGHFISTNRPGKLDSRAIGTHPADNSEDPPTLLETESDKLAAAQELVFKDQRAPML